MFFVDDFSRPADRVPIVRKALHQMIDQQMQPEDRVAIVRECRVRCRRDFTTDKNLPHAAADQVRWNSAGKAGMSLSGAVEGSRKPGPGAPQSQPRMGACCDNDYRHSQGRPSSCWTICDRFQTGHVWPYLHGNDHPDFTARRSFYISFYVTAGLNCEQGRDD